MIRTSCWTSSLVVLALAAPLAGQTQDRNVSKSGTTAGAFLEIPVGARAVSIGSAFVAMSGDATTLYWNPAGAARLPLTQVLFAHNSWFGELNFDYAAVVLPIGEAGALGLSITSFGAGDMPVRTIDRPDGTGEVFSASSIAIGVHYARNLSDRFSIGFTGKYVSESIWHMQAQAFAADIGALFTTGFFNGLRIGALISNFGTDLKLAGRDTRSFMRVDERKMGSNDQIPTNIELDSWPLPLNFQFGIATEVVNNEAYRLTMAMDALHPSDNYESINVGAEFAFQEFLFLRGGYRAIGLFDREGGLAAGGGVLANLFGGGMQGRLDYGYSDYGRLGAIHVLTVGITL